MPRMPSPRVPLALAAAVVLLGASPVARADDEPRDDVRVLGRCTGGTTAELRVRARDDGELRLDLVLRSRRRPARWHVVVVHERRIAYRGTVRAGTGASLRLTLADLAGPDSVSVRATGTGTQSCRASATIFGD
jgi:hypothetical protein